MTAASERQALRMLLAPRDRPRAAALVACLVLAALAEGIGVGAIFPLLQIISNPDLIAQHAWLTRAHAALGAPSPERFVILCCAALLLFFVLKNAFLGFVSVAQSRVVFDKEAELESALLRGYLFAPYEQQFGRAAAERVRIVTAEVSRVSSGVLLPLLVLIAEGLVSVMIMAVLFALKPGLTLIGISAFGAAAALFYAAFRPMIGRNRQTRVVAGSDMFRVATQSLASLKEIKVFGREAHFTAEFERPVQAHARASASFAALNVVPRLVVESLLVSALLVLIMASATAGSAMQEVLPTLALFGLASIRMLPSVTRMLSAVTTIRFYMPAVTMVAAELERARETRTGPAAAPASPRPIESLELRGVGYRYPGAERDALVEVSAEFRRGRIVAVVGRSGSGKTTLADIVLGLLHPVRGRILVNGAEVRSLREDFGFVQALVPQECNILDDTAKRNVAFGVPDERIDEARVWRALELARLRERIEAAPSRLETEVGKSGLTLSGGERQRLVIARALYHEPSLIVFDEATSALDATTEAEIVGTVRAIAARMAVIVIAHRPALIQAADLILVLDEGRVAASGGYDELIATEPRIRLLLRETDT
jgi:ABC-type multidrug transport system fused ATPase/permease subunit